MIRDRLKRLAGRLLEPPAPPPPAPAARPAAPPPPPPAREEEEPGPDVEIEAPGIQRLIAEGARPVFLDIREVHEISQGHVGGAVLIPMNQVPGRLAELPRGAPLIVYCAAGVRSYGVAHYLREQGFAQAWSLVGGIGAWLETGAPYVQPPWPTGRYALTWPVRLTEAAATARGLSDRAGTVQEIRLDGDRRIYAVGVNGARVDGLQEEELEPIGRG